MSRVEPWTRRFRFSWPQTVEYLDHRYAILRRFEELGVVRQFRAGEDRITVRLGDAHHVVVYGLGSLEGSLLRPDADEERLKAALSLIFETLKPQRLLRPRVDFQWLVALDLEYDEARVRTALQGFGEAGASVVDWSVLADGKLSGPKGTYRAEFGIVEAAEMPVRLSRQTGRVGAAERDVPATIWPLATLPSVGWFYDVRCTLEEAPSPTVDEVWSFVDSTQSVLERLMSAMMNRFVRSASK